MNRLWDDRDDAFEEDDEFEEELDAAPPSPEVEPELVPGPREGQREAVQARALLEKAERLLDKVQPDDRAEIERLMTAVRNALTDRQVGQRDDGVQRAGRHAVLPGGRVGSV